MGGVIRVWNITKTEFIKLKRCNIIWAGIALMFLSVLLTLFTSIANDGSVWDFSYLIEQVIKNNMSTIFPMCITLIAGYIIASEKKNDTLKNILTIPISFKQILLSKVIICGLISVFLGIICTIFTIISEIIIGFPGFSLQLSIQALFEISLVNLFLYISVLPIIIITSFSSNGFLVGVIVAFVYGYGGMFASGNMTLSNLYPITASLGLIQYRSYDPAVNWNIPICIFSIGIMLLISVIIINSAKNPEGIKVASKKSSKQIRKKGW